jgi:hypothetical protein
MRPASAAAPAASSVSPAIRLAAVHASSGSRAPGIETSVAPRSSSSRIRTGDR